MTRGEGTPLLRSTDFQPHKNRLAHHPERSEGSLFYESDYVVSVNSERRNGVRLVKAVERSTHQLPVTSNQ